MGEICVFKNNINQYETKNGFANVCSAILFFVHLVKLIFCFLIFHFVMLIATN